MFTGQWIGRCGEGGRCTATRRRRRDNGPLPARPAFERGTQMPKIILRIPTIAASRRTRARQRKHERPLLTRSRTGRALRARRDCVTCDFRRSRIPGHTGRSDIRNEVGNGLLTFDHRSITNKIYLILFYTFILQKLYLKICRFYFGI